MPYHFNYEVPEKPHGTWTVHVREDKEGAMWVGYGLEKYPGVQFREIRVNHCPLTGTPATKQMEATYCEERAPEGDTYYYKKYSDCKSYDEIVK